MHSARVEKSDSQQRPNGSPGVAQTARVGGRYDERRDVPVVTSSVYPKPPVLPRLPPGTTTDQSGQQPHPRPNVYGGKEGMRRRRLAPIESTGNSVPSTVGQSDALVPQHAHGQNGETHSQGVLVVNPERPRYPATGYLHDGQTGHLTQEAINAVMLYQPNVEATLQHWAHSLHLEGVQHNETLRLAQFLFTHAVAGKGSDVHPSVTRVAVSCLLLEQISAVFGRYNSVLGNVSETLLRAVYVPDTQEMRDLLGSVEAPIKIPRSVPEAEAKACEDLLAPYSRKTYFMAYEQLSAAVKAYSKSNRKIEVRLSRQTKVFQSTVKHWISSLQRNFFTAWRNYTRRRNQLRAKYKALFLRIRSDECRLKAIRRWRDYGSRVKKTAAVDAASATELQTLRVSTEQTQEQINALTQYNSSLSTQISDLETERQKLQDEILALEEHCTDLTQRSNEMERVGTELLEGALMQEGPPKAATPLASMVAWAEQSIEDVGGMIDGAKNVFAPLLTDEDLAESVPFSALATVMLWFGGDTAPTRERVVQLHMNPAGAPTILCDMYETLVGSPCIVTEEQLASKKRGVFLLFLSGLMRYVSQWLICKPPSIPVARRIPPGPNSSQTWMERVRNQQFWVTTSLAAQHAALEAALRQPVLLTMEEQDDLGRFFDIQMGKVADILPTDNNHHEHFISLLKTLNRVYPELRKIYYAYANPILTFLDFMRLMKDCHLIGDRKLQKRTVDLTARVVWKLEGSNAEIFNREVKPNQFVELIIRLSLAYTRRVSRDNSIELSAASAVSFITEHLVPHALHSDVDRFKSSFRHPSVQQTIQKYKINLRRAFSRYATEDGGEGMSKQAFIQLARDCKWLQKSVTQDVLTDVFKRVQQTDQGSLDCLDLNEFVEVLAVVSIYYDPNPFTPLASKVGPFLEEKLFNPLQL